MRIIRPFIHESNAGAKDGLSLCALVCPVENCITMKQVDTALPAMTWNDHMRRLAADPGCALPPTHSGD